MALGDSSAGLAARAASAPCRPGSERRRRTSEQPSGRARDTVSGGGVAAVLGTAVVTLLLVGLAVTHDRHRHRGGTSS